jgi:nitroreductase
LDTWQAIKERRSVRSFREEAVPRETLLRLVQEAAIWAPSGGNAQTWRFVIIDDRTLVNKVRMISPGLLGQPAAVIAICQDMEEAGRKGSQLGETLALLDSGMAAQNIMLAAHDLGLGTCAVASFHRQGLQTLLGLPPAVVPLLLISVGVPGDIPPPPQRRTDVWRCNREPESNRELAD